METLGELSFVMGEMINFTGVRSWLRSKIAGAILMQVSV
tara:strand:+ start:528 stop:644 length:117 start_codon:yes stop_codon:yes gene_type:complete